MKKFTIRNYDIIRQSGYVSPEDIDTAYRFGSRLVQSDRVILIALSAIGMPTLVGIFSVITADEWTDQRTLGVSSIANVVGILLVLAILQYRAYAQRMHYIRNRMIEIDEFLTEIIGNNTEHRGWFEGCKDREDFTVAVHNVLLMHLHSLTTHGDNERELLAKCFGLFNMSPAQKHSLGSAITVT